MKTTLGANKTLPNQIAEIDPEWLVSVLGVAQAEALTRALNDPNTLQLLANLVSACPCIAGSIYCTCKRPKRIDWAGYVPNDLPNWAKGARRF